MRNNYGLNLSNSLSRIITANRKFAEKMIRLVGSNNYATSTICSGWAFYCNDEIKCKYSKFIGAKSAEVFL